MAENRDFCQSIVFNRRNKNIPAEEKGGRLEEVLKKSKVRKSKEDELYPDEEAKPAGEQAVKEVVGEARPCQSIDFYLP